MMLRLALRSDTDVNRTTGHATKNYKIAITLMNLLKLASIDKNRLSACYVNGSCVYTTTLRQIHRGVLIFIRSAKRSGALL